MLIDGLSTAIKSINHITRYNDQMSDGPSLISYSQVNIQYLDIPFQRVHWSRYGLCLANVYIACLNDYIAV